VSDVRSYFSDLVTWANARLTADEILTCYLAAEDSNFVRFNRNLIRQAGSVSQRRLTLDLIAGNRHASGSIQLSQDQDMDRAALASMIDGLREQRRVTPEDPYLAVSTDNPSTEYVSMADGRDPGSVVDEIQTVAGSRDLVGIYADGTVNHGFASSLGQRNWYQTDTFNFDWSFYLHGDKAVKNSYGGLGWDSTAFAAKVDAATHQLESLSRPALDLKPGRAACVSVAQEQQQAHLAPAIAVGIADQLPADHARAGPGTVGVRREIVAGAVAVKAPARVQSERAPAGVVLVLVV